MRIFEALFNGSLPKLSTHALEKCFDESDPGWFASRRLVHTPRADVAHIGLAFVPAPVVPPHPLTTALVGREWRASSRRRRVLDSGLPHARTGSGGRALRTGLRTGGDVLMERLFFPADKVDAGHVHKVPHVGRNGIAGLSDDAKRLKNPAAFVVEHVLEQVPDRHVGRRATLAGTIACVDVRPPSHCLTCILLTCILLTCILLNEWLVESPAFEGRVVGGLVLERPLVGIHRITVVSSETVVFTRPVVELEQISHFLFVDRHFLVDVSTLGDDVHPAPVLRLVGCERER